jgi:hypothetical protein
MRFRQGGFIEHPEDYKDEPVIHDNREYYWWTKKLYLP